MASITTWTRLEPRARSADMRPSLEARVHDPLWLLARQWQVGEFIGDDAGSPVSVRLRGETAPVTTFSAGGQTAAYDGKLPLEVTVEREAGDGADRRLRAEGGSQFLRSLATAGMGAYRAAFLAAYRLDPPSAADTEAMDAVAARYMAMMAGRVPDGDKLRAAFAAGRLPAVPAIPATDQPAVLKAALAWRAWYEAFAGPPAAGPQAWHRERMEYAFALGAVTSAAAVTLNAAEYADGRLDWEDFDARVAAPPPGAKALTPFVQTALPAPARYAGMPAPRWWQFEDARVDFGGIEAAPEDLARMLVAEFAGVYGNDWYLLPVELAVGTVTEVASLVVTDTFGERTLLASADEQDWSVFRLTQPGGRFDRYGGLFLAPALGASLEAEPLEEVLLLRDELANLGWAVERTVAGATGRPVDRARDAAIVRGGVPVTPAVEPAAALAYELAATVPEHWIPLLPEEIAPGINRLRRGAMERVQDGQLEPVVPKGRLLEPGRELTLFEEEVPRSGARITRAYQYTRWTDGSSHLWIGRRKGAGRGEGSSGLRFDSVVPSVAQPASHAAEVDSMRAYADAHAGAPVDLARLRPGQRAWVVAALRNTGSVAWRRSGPDAVALSTVLPRGHASPLATSEWLEPSRPARLEEPEVQPGAVGTFVFAIAAPLGAGPFVESFNLVTARGAWFPASAIVQVSGEVGAGSVAPLTWQAAGGAVTAPLVAATEADGRLLVLAMGINKALQARRATAEGGWEDWSSLEGVLTSSPAAARHPDGRLEVFVRGGGNVLFSRRQTAPGGPYGPWKSLAGTLAGPPVAITPPDGRMLVFARQSNNTLGMLRLARPGGDFAPWQSLGGTLASDPAAGLDLDGRVEVFVRGATDVLYGSRQTAPGGAFQPWRALGGKLASAPIVTTRGGGRLVVMAAQQGGALAFIEQGPADAEFGAWQSLGGTLVAAPAAVRHADGRLEAIVPGAGGTIFARRELTPGGAFEPTYQNLGAKAVGSPLAARLADGRVVVFAVQADGTVLYREQRSPGGQWSQAVQDWQVLSGVELGVRSTLGVDAVVRPQRR